MEKKLILKKQSGNIIAEILSFTYNAKRMGGAPTISATLHSFNELALTTDDYVEFNGERYYIKHTPTSSKSNTDARYKYDLEFVSERVMLDDIYFHDASWSGNEPNKAISKGSNFHFVGSIRALADKINASLAFSKVVGYRVAVSGEFGELEEKHIQFSDVFLSNAIQEFYNTYKIPYYFEWDENNKITYIHVTNGSASSPTEVFEYGKDNALLSITKSNANYKIINKCTGVGSSENIPYYYPNLSSTGEHTFNADEVLGDVSINYDILDKHTNLRDGATLTYHKKPSEVLYNYLVVYSKWERKAANVTSEYPIKIDGATSLKDTSSAKLQNDGYFKVKRVSIEFTAQANDEVSFEFQQGVQTIDGTDGVVDEESVKLEYEIKEGDALSYVGKTVVASTALNDGVFSFTAAKAGTYSASVYILFKIKGGSQKKELPINLSATFTPHRKVYKEDYFTFDDSDKEIGVSLSGVRVANPKDGGKIVVSETLNWLEPQGTLMPTIYRETNGLERYYIASNEDVVVDGYQYGFDGHEFPNPFIEGRPKEHIITVDDLKPTIKGMSVNGERIDMFSAFAYDADDNDEIDENNHYKHPYFYAKLRKLGFNLFEHASEKGEMTISFTSGQCAACNFTVMVDEKTRKNLVQVDGDKVFIGSTAKDEQQDTVNNEVWIALKKDDNTMGVIMPNVTANKKPSVDDTFVITNINLPTPYIIHAEKVLEDKIKEYLISNNDDKFNFSIKFSRIYLAENEDVRNSISENSSLCVKYQNSEVLLYVSSYTYKMSAGDALPEITVELTDTLASNKGLMKNVISQVKMEVMSSISNVDIVAQGARAFIRKDQNDQTAHRLSANELDVATNSKIGENLDVENNVSVGGELTVGRKTTIKENLNVGADITVGDYKEILGEVDGAKIAQDGSASFKSIRANYMEVFTMIYNQIKASSAYTVFDDTGTVIDLSLNDGVYTITFDDSEFNTKDANGVGVQPFVVGDILHGIVNNVNNYDYSQSGECWLRVTYTPTASNGLQSNQIKAVLFGDSDVPTAPNLAPTKSMVLAHRGNVDSVNHSDRQSTFYISSKDGNIVQLLDVSSPKLFKIEDGYSNYGIVLGKLPDDLFEYVKQAYSFVNKNHPYAYTRGLIAQDFMRLDYLGRPIKDERARGEWNQTDAVGNDPYRSYNATDVTYYDTVTYEGSLWQCFTDKTEEAPSKNSTAWTLLVEKGQSGTSVSIVDTEVKYATNNSGTLAPTSGWQDTVPKVDDGSYLWTRTVVSYSDGKSTEAYSVSRIGIDGKGIQSSDITYAMKANTDVKPEDFNEIDWGEFPTKLVDGYWLYTRTIVTYSDGEHATSYDVTQIGQGSYYAGLQEYYAKAQNDKTAPSGYPDTKDFVDGVATYPSGENFTIGSAWTTTRPTLNSQEAYLWNFSVSRDSKGNKYVTYPVCIGNFAKGIVSVVESYAISQHSKPNVANAKYPNDITSWTDEQNGAVPTEEKPYQWNYTLTTYNDGSKDEIYHVSSVKGMDSTSVQYDLQTNVNIIYIHDRENASTQSINLVVGKTTSKGYTEIDDSSELRNEGFIIQYAVDSHEPRYTLDFERTTMLLEGDEDIILTDESGRVLTYEFSVTDILSVEDHIMFYLVEVDSNGNAVKDWASREVDVVRDGGGAFTLELDTEKVVVNVDAGNKIIDNSRTIQLVAQPKIGGKGVNVISVSAKDNASNTLVVNPIGAYGYKVEYRIEKGTTYNLPEFVEFTAKAFDLNNVEITASSKVVFMKSQQGIVGPMGSKGASYFPQGNWNSGISYEYAYATDLQGNFILDEKGEKIVSGKPYVFYQKEGEANGYYYVLNTPKSTIGLNPSDAYNSNNKEWVWVENLKNVFAEILMAQWANLAKAVFEGDYMFSTKGVRMDGSFGDYSKDMFTNGRLNGNFVPNLFLDLNNGGAKFGKLSESFVTIANDVYKHDIQFNTCHNISRSFVANKACVVTLPKTKNKDQWVEDGSHCTIINEYDFDYTRYPTSATYDNSAVLVCADDLFFDIEHKVEADDFNEQAPTNGWFIWKNYRTKFLLLAPCSMLKLRSCKIENNGIVWFVENSGEFEILGTSITFSKDNQVSSEDEYTLTSHRLTDSESLDRNAVVVGSSVYNTYTQIVNGKRESKDTAWWFFKEGNQEGVYFERKD